MNTGNMVESQVIVALRNEIQDLSKQVKKQNEIIDNLNNSVEQVAAAMLEAISTLNYDRDKILEAYRTRFENLYQTINKGIVDE